MSDVPAQILISNKISPVLVDVGASAKPPAVWSKIASASTYLGFDPDSRDFSTNSEAGYARSLKFNFAIGPDRSASQKTLYLTHSPYCSSLLPPIQEQVSNYTFAAEFSIENTRSVQTMPLADALKQAGLNSIDWLKLDSQGLDFAIYDALPESVKNSLLALDLEPGLVPAYQGEELFADAHPKLLRDGFWLADMAVKGVPRINQESSAWLQQSYPELPNLHTGRLFKNSPVWCNILYFRTIPWLKANLASKQKLITLWCFAFSVQLWGYAFELLHHYQLEYGKDEAYLAMEKNSLQNMQSFRKKLNRVFPARMARQIVKKVWGE